MRLLRTDTRTDARWVSNAYLRALKKESGECGGEEEDEEEEYEEEEEEEEEEDEDDDEAEESCEGSHAHLTATASVSQSVTSVKVRASLRRSRPSCGKWVLTNGRTQLILS
jgi:CO dehydrogenase/acetyl-CoA synthase beta subunit